jgi:NhaB family Na+:H+ antiporter
MAGGVTQALRAAFLGEAPHWYKTTIVLFLVLNPMLFALDPYTAAWALVLEFIFTLAMALRCYPLQPGGLLTLEAVAIGMTTPERVFIETTGAIEVVSQSGYKQLHRCHSPPHVPVALLSRHRIVSDRIFPFHAGASQ